MCSKVIQPASVVVVFETLLSSAAITVDEEKGNPSWQARADFYVICILSCLPWGGAELAEQVPEEIERVLVGIQAYMSIRRHSSDSGLSFFEDGESGGDVEKDFLEDLWERIQVLSNNGWKVESVPRPHLSFEAQLVAGKSHEFGPISCPEQPELPSTITSLAYGKQKHEAELKYPQRTHRLNIFPASKTEDLQPIDRFVVEEYLLDVLLFFNGCQKECASFMVGLPVPFRYEYLMAETIFSQLLLLPHPPFKPIYYTLVIMDLFVAGAVRALFDKIADLDMECRTRLILWFSHHLWAPQRVFVQEVFEREVRLSYWDKIKQSIENAPALEKLLPPKGGPNFKYSGVNGQEKTEQEQALSAELSNKVKERQSASEIIVWIEKSIYPIHGLEVTLSVVVQTLLDIGSKSFTHLITILERYGQVMAKLCSDQDKQVMLITEVLSNAVSKTYNRITDLRKEISSLKKGVITAEEAASKAKAYLEAAESKLTLVEGEPVLEAKEALLARALDENEVLDSTGMVLFLSLYKNFCTVLMERLPDASSDVTLQSLKSIHGDSMAVDLEESSNMEVDDENGIPKKSPNSPTFHCVAKIRHCPAPFQSNEGKASNTCNVKEKEQWCLSTLGYVKAFSRQYASEIWPHIEKLDAEVFTEDAHPLLRKAVYSGLGRLSNEL
ncbi:Nuclear cap-binding protein subunit 1 [Hibiscus syriacus]|uniref:Nuclear cap-binding protein subunit 1 n=1 Tax=Hibiscus syriacus TaxID=106335 RepID=A0A6A3CZ56_HIBSY|nr:Nuclear cap-binding protein subunit 1 [Hibiscus syriacus]